MAKELTNAQRDDLIEQYVEIVVDNMDTQSLVEYAQWKLAEYYDSLSNEEIKNSIDEHDDELYDELVDNITHVKCESNNKNNVTYNEVDYVEQCITEGYDYRDCVDTLPGINDTLDNNVTSEIA